jgi:hypothetical protein
MHQPINHMCASCSVGVLSQPVQPGNHPTSWLPGAGHAPGISAGYTPVTQRLLHASRTPYFYQYMNYKLIYVYNVSIRTPYRNR